MSGRMLCSIGFPCFLKQVASFAFSGALTEVCCLQPESKTVEHAACGIYCRGKMRDETNVFWNVCKPQFGCLIWVHVLNLKAFQNI